MSVGGNEIPNYMAAILQYNSRVSARKYPDLAYEFKLIEGERHAGMQNDSYARGLTFIFAPLAAVSGPSPNFGL